MLTAIQYLEQVKKLDELISAKKAERDRLIEIAEDISPSLPDGMPRSFTGTPTKKVENAAINLVINAEELDKAIARYEQKLAEVVKNLEKLPPKQYGALHRHYIRYMSWESAAEDMDISTRQILRIRKKALKNLQNVIECHY